MDDVITFVLIYFREIKRDSSRGEGQHLDSFVEMARMVNMPKRLDKMHISQIALKSKSAIDFIASLK